MITPEIRMVTSTFDLAEVMSFSAWGCRTIWEAIERRIRDKWYMTTLGYALHIKASIEGHTLRCDAIIGGNSELDTFEFEGVQLQTRVEVAP